jgi:hypothetical protein
MRLVSGGKDNKMDADGFLFKSNLWLLATAWQTLKSRKNFEGVLFVDASGGADGDPWDESKLKCNANLGLPKEVRTILLGDVSYSGQEAMKTSELVTVLMPKNCRAFRVAHCDYVLGAMHTAGRHAGQTGGCHLAAGTKWPSSITSLIKMAKQLRGKNIKVAQSAKKRMNKRGKRQLRKLIASYLRKAVKWLQWMDEKTMWENPYAPAFVTQFKIPDTTSFTGKSRFKDVLYSTLNSGYSKFIGVGWDGAKRPRIEPYKKSSG